MLAHHIVLSENVNEWKIPKRGNGGSRRDVEIRNVRQGTGRGGGQD